MGLLKGTASRVFEAPRESEEPAQSSVATAMPVTGKTLEYNAKNELQKTKNRGCVIKMGALALGVCVLVAGCNEVGSLFNDIKPKADITTIQQVKTSLEKVDLSTDTIVLKGTAESTDNVTTKVDIKLPLLPEFQVPASTMGESAYVKAEVAVISDGGAITLQGEQDKNGQWETLADINPNLIEVQLINETHNEVNNDQEFIKIMNALGANTESGQLDNSVLGMNEDNLKATCAETMVTPNVLAEAEANYIRSQMETVAEATENINPVVYSTLEKLSKAPVLIQYVAPGRITGQESFVPPSDLKLQLPPKIIKNETFDMGFGSMTFKSTGNVCAPTKDALADLSDIKNINGYVLEQTPYAANG